MKNSTSVQCSSCKQWCHFRSKNNCSKLKSIKAYKEHHFKCPPCSNQLPPPTTPPLPPTTPTYTTSTHSTSFTTTSIYTTTSTSTFTSTHTTTSTYSPTPTSTRQPTAYPPYPRTNHIKKGHENSSVQLQWHKRKT